jgi:hypothetical protein
LDIVLAYCEKPPEEVREGIPLIKNVSVIAKLWYSTSPPDTSKLSSLRNQEYLLVQTITPFYIRPIQFLVRCGYTYDGNRANLEAIYWESLLEIESS